MSNISVDLKVIETHAPSVARSAGVSEDRVIAGLVRLWHRCWSTAQATLQRAEVAGAFGPDRLDDLISALEVDFLEKQPDGAFRVRGADQYLRIKEGRRRGAEKTNAARAERRSSVAPASLKDALSPNTEHRTPNTVSPTAAAAPPAQVVRLPATKPLDPEKRHDSGAAYMAWLNSERLKAGLLEETEKTVPQVLFDRFFSEAMMELNADGARLDATVAAFSRDPYWRKEGLPIRALIKNWRKYAPRKAGNG